MVQSQFSLTWDSYKSSICNGFSALQQNGEFVDMTLAADGHLVKVHQVLMALASPYLKELITSAPCQHPVIFLNNVSHGTLCMLLEYIYTGEVIIPSDGLSSFAETAKALHIKGLENLTNSENIVIKASAPQAEVSETLNIGNKRKITNMRDSTKPFNLPTTARKILIKHDNHILSLPDISKREVSMESQDDMHEYSTMMEESGIHDSDDESKPEPNSQGTTFSTSTSVEKPSSNLQFTVSIRGSLQVILNRYIYNLHSITHRTGVRRWRCVDYRNNRCMAFVVTKGNVVLNRANLHNHSFHDKKILAKIEKKAVFSALDDVENYKEKEASKNSDNDATEEQDCVSLSFSSGVNDDKAAQTLS